mmetsp:Transcript_12802/g.32262  ORF Transcript_12802/g.32262 Transcript_12802/m.32262 type:complete len:252 (-) Transcript_12802:544-1299(-)
MSLYPRGASSTLERSHENTRIPFWFLCRPEKTSNTLSRLPKYTKTSAATIKSNPEALDVGISVFSRVISSKSRSMSASYSLESLPPLEAESVGSPHPFVSVQCPAISSILGEASTPIRVIRSLVPSMAFRNSRPANPVPQPASSTLRTVFFCFPRISATLEPIICGTRYSNSWVSFSSKVSAKESKSSATNSFGFRVSSEISSRSVCASLQDASRLTAFRRAFSALSLQSWPNKDATRASSSFFTLVLFLK